MWWPFSSDSSRWQDRLEQYEKIIDQYIRHDPSEEVPQKLNKEIKEFEAWVEEIRTGIQPDREALEAEVQELNTLREEIQALEAELKTTRSQLDNTDANAVEAFNARVSQHEELMERYTPKAAELERRSNELNERITQFNKKHDAHARELEERQVGAKKHLEEYQRWRERKGPGKFFRELNQLFAVVQKACRQDGGESRCAPFRDRLRALRRELGERARNESEKGESLLVVEVKLLDDEPCMMTFDPGSTVTSVSPEMVDALGMEDDVGANVELHLPAGITINKPQLLIRKMSVQDHSAQYVRGVVLEETMCGVDGSLGLSFLNRYDYHIEGNDPRRLTLTPRSSLLEEVPPVDLDNVGENQTFDVFICHKSEDANTAREIYEFLRDAGYRVFFSPVTLAEIGQTAFMQAIDKAVENSRNMIVLASSRERLEQPWIRSEWGMFENMVRSRRKRGQIVPVLCGSMSPNHLPPALSQYHSILLDAPNWKTELVSFLPKRR